MPIADPGDRDDARGLVAEGSPSTLLIPFGIALIALGYFVARFRFLCDDAFISFRYARNLVEGLGLRFNPGVEAPVEGYTDLGWILLIAPFEWLALDVGAWSQGISVACAVALLFYVVTFVARRTGLRSLPATAAGLMFAAHPTVGVWATSGLGTMPLALALFGTFERLLGDPERPRGVQAGIFGAAAVLLRADGIYWLGVIFVIAAVGAARERRVGLVRAIVACGAIVAATFSGHLLFRLGYYGEWLPQTARAKVVPSARFYQRGLYYLVASWLEIPWNCGVLVAGAWLALRRRVWALPCLGFVGASYLYPVLVGGDFMAMWRFLLPAVPFVAILSGMFVDEVLRVRGALAASAVAVAMLATTVPVAFDAQLTPRALREACHFRWRDPYYTEREIWARMKFNTKQWSVVGRALAEHTHEGASIVTGTVGAIGYFSRRFLYDRNGLVTRGVSEAAPEPTELGNPGHDRTVPSAFFAEFGPTYRSASLFRGDRSERRLYRRSMAATGKPLRIIYLKPSEGYPPDTCLVLVSYADDGG